MDRARGILKDEEALKLLSDPEWRIRNLYTITNKEGRRVIFEPNDCQALVNAMPEHRKMILKSRQIGFSTNELIKMFDHACWNENVTAVIIAHEIDSLKKLFRTVQRAYKYMHPDLRPVLDRGGGSKYEYFFPELNSRIYCDLESRSDTATWLHISEAAFMKDSSKLKATLQTVPLGGRVTMETTPNGMSNHYYDMWMDQDQPYRKVFFPWYSFKQYRMPCKEKLILTDDERELIAKAKRLYKIDIDNEQIMFRRFKKAELKVSSFDKTRVTFEQEYPEDDISCFLASGESVMDLFKINKMISQLGSPLSDSEGLKMYVKPVKGRRYVIGADVAEGVRRDYSVGVCIDVESRKIVAKLRSHWKPSDFATKLYELGKMYSSPGPVWPILAVERNNHGHAVLLKLDETLGYPALYVNPNDERLGWKTDSITRPIMINAFIDAIEDQYLSVPDKDILNECLTLVDINGKIEAVEGKFDDCVIATAIALQVCLSNSLSVYDGIENKIKV